MTNRPITNAIDRSQTSMALTLRLPRHRHDAGLIDYQLSTYPMPRTARRGSSSSAACWHFLRRR
ncbi:hypothetical protein [Lysobacter gummosus]|uniref:hypothetical protein n=1 Tax=Lysobacter gummosus TaxID=262324 RepID=UPI00362AA718